MNENHVVDFFYFNLSRLSWFTELTIMCNKERMTAPKDFQVGKKKTFYHTQIFILESAQVQKIPLCHLTLNSHTMVLRRIIIVSKLNKGSTQFDLKLLMVTRRSERESVVHQSSFRGSLSWRSHFSLKVQSTVLCFGTILEGMPMMDSSIRIAKQWIP
jgi:hypothetical protein